LAPNFCTPRKRHVLGFQDNAHAFGVDLTLEPFGDLGGHALLDLKVPGEQLHYAAELAQADDPFSGEILDVRHAVKMEQVVHAQRVKRGRPRDDQLVDLAKVVAGLR
jgi:hypothetical protein